MIPRAQISAFCGFAEGEWDCRRTSGDMYSSDPHRGTMGGTVVVAVLLASLILLSLEEGEEEEVVVVVAVERGGNAFRLLLFGMCDDEGLLRPSVLNEEVVVMFVLL